MGILDETYVCERCNRTVNEMTSTCGDITCPLFDPRYEEEDEMPFEVAKYILDEKERNDEQQ